MSYGWPVEDGREHPDYTRRDWKIEPAKFNSVLSVYAVQPITDENALHQFSVSTTHSMGNKHRGDWFDIVPLLNLAIGFKSPALRRFFFRSIARSFRKEPPSILLIQAQLFDVQRIFASWLNTCLLNGFLSMKSNPFADPIFLRFESQGSN